MVIVVVLITLIFQPYCSTRPHQYDNKLHWTSLELRIMYDNRYVNAETIECFIKNIFQTTFCYYNTWFKWFFTISIIMILRAFLFDRFKIHLLENKIYFNQKLLYSFFLLLNDHCWDSQSVFREVNCILCSLNAILSLIKFIIPLYVL